jgi:hypothetical protein
MRYGVFVRRPADNEWVAEGAYSWEPSYMRRVAQDLQREFSRYGVLIICLDDMDRDGFGLAIVSPDWE